MNSDKKWTRERICEIFSDTNADKWKIFFEGFCAKN
jgi:hypothetical protein